MTLKPSKNKIIESNDIQWVLIEEIAKGGNGHIWNAYDQATPSNLCVFKFLPATNRQIDFLRLKREFEVHTTLYQSPNKYSVLPIFDYRLNENDFSWVRLPLARSFDKGIAETAFLQKIELLIKLCNDIVHLHASGYCHRDIKPNNLLFLDNELYLADFGLVTDPQETTGITPHGTRMGNYQTIAPEMRKTGKDLETEDYKKSDIYSLGVTIWMILTQDQHGFDGEYSNSQREKLEEALFKEKIVLNDIHNIIYGCTKTKPSERIALEEIIHILSQVKESLKNHHKYLDDKWVDVCNKLNPYQASKIELTDIQAIYNFLNTFYSFEPDLHHAFFPDTGGLDIRGVDLNEKHGFIILNLGSFKNWLKPKRLIYRNFLSDISNNYIYLECENILFPYESQSSETIEYTLINNQFLTDIKHYMSSLFEESTIYGMAERITFIHNGSFLFVKNFSAYDKSDECYDAIHSKNFKNFEEFDQYFCEKYVTNTFTFNEVKLPFEFKIEKKNISEPVSFKFLVEDEIQLIFDRINSVRHNKIEDPIENIILHLKQGVNFNNIFKEYSLDKIKELWCLYNLGKKIYGLEINQKYYDDFLTTCIDDDGILISDYDYNSLSNKINGIISGTLNRFINQALKSLKRTTVLIDKT